ncbi:hypothetical protein AAVH_04401 [Aphelenchoides avenae]|nr:hypothetical protein AAVH_04401 [Aphelenchus avenae]
MLLRTRNDVNKVHPIVHFEDQFKAFGHNWRYVAASRIRPKTTLHRAHATALLFNRDLQKHYEIDGTHSTIVQAPVDISEHRFTVFERL